MIRAVIVEDDPMVLEVNKAFLKKSSFYTCIGSAGTGKDALELITETKPDLVLLDIYLPDMSGIDVLREIRKRDIPADVIMITAARDVKTVQQIFRFGAVDYLVKPFRYERFKQALDTYYTMWKKLNHLDAVSQADIDEWNEKKEQEETLPKGLSEVTLKQVLMALHDEEKPKTAEQLASKLGMARVTVRRYLDYLVKTNQIQMQVEYGRVGRPSNYYFV
ncbi:response regulator [Compostibacillus humi]|uniref:Response regulator n=1 Tax=Compostibacillus humi TaxID=1245525 RepID=A0A8J2ZQ04_9BACI|nr:response regulator [Compostibacillus humi]GGH67847.1 response regulator [Compostibacillus humi]